MKRTVLVVAAAAGLLAAAASAQQDQWDQQVRRMLRDAATRFEREGYRMSHEIYTGSLNDDSRELVTVQLDAGRQYYLMGACDTDCDDMDLLLFDPAGAQVSSDLLTDDFPIVNTAVERAGRYRVEVRMPSCSAQPCRYGLGVFAK
jgi:hypothetical protein